MPFLDWKPEYSVGEGEMDSQHKKLIGYMNAFHDANATGRNAMARMALNSLLQFTKQHFHDEEQIMAKRYFPGLAAHKNLHENLLALAEKLVSAYVAKPSEKSAETIANFLRNWLVNHILGEDMQYAPYMAH